MGRPLGVLASWRENTGERKPLAKARRRKEREKADKVNRNRARIDSSPSIFLSALSALSAVSHPASGGTEALRPPRTLEVIFHDATASLLCDVLRGLPFEIHCVRGEGD